MSEYSVTKAVRSTTESTVQDVTVDAAVTDGATGTQETTYICSEWSKWYGYYKQIPELYQALNMIATWTVGRGFTCKSIKQNTKLESIRGYGTDSFDDILFNMVVQMHICGDAYAEIIRNEEGDILNIKPLDPSTIRIVVDKKGILKRYEQVGKTGKVETKFEIEDILHFCNKRAADNIHGQSDVEILEGVIDFYNEMFADARKVYHLFGKPIMKVEIDSNNQTKITDFKEKMEEILDKAEYGIYIPKETVTVDTLSVPANATLNYTPMINLVRDRFFQVLGIPQVLVGSSGEFTESTAKIAFTAFEQTVRAAQRHIEQVILNQLFIEINLEPPVTLRNELIADTQKDGMNQQMGMNESDLAEVPQPIPVPPQSQGGVPNA